MKVKIGSKIYDSDQEPILLVLSDRDKLNINHMAPDKDTYISFPSTEEYRDNDFKKIKEFMAAGQEKPKKKPRRSKKNKKG